MITTEQHQPQPMPAVQPVLESAMRSGEDDEPEMTIADRHSGETPPDPNGDGRLTIAEADTLLGSDTDKASEPASEDAESEDRNDNDV